MEVVCNFTKDLENELMGDDLNGKITIKKRGPNTIEIQLQLADKYLTMNISSDEYVKLQVEDCSKEFLDIGLRL